jgi:hypothetical protein
MMSAFSIHVTENADAVLAREPNPAAGASGDARADTLHRISSAVVSATPDRLPARA